MSNFSKRKQLSEADKKHILDNIALLGVLGLNNVSVVDRPFSTLMNTGTEMLNSIAVYAGQAPVKPTVIPAAVPTAGQIVRLQSGVTVNDLVAEVRFDMPILDGVIQDKLAVVGYLITQRFKNNDVTTPYELDLLHYQQYGTGFAAPVIYTKISRNPQVEPTAGANSATEFLLLSVNPGQVFNYDAGLAKYTTATDQQQGYAMPILFANVASIIAPDLSLTQGSALIFKNQAGIPQTLTVTPIIAGGNNYDDIVDMLLGGMINEH